MDLDMVKHLTQPIALEAPLVLAVDDDEDSLVLLAGVLEILGCACVTAASAGEALLQVKIRQPDLILLDIVLPDMNGIELLPQLKQEYLASSPIAIAVTGLALQEEREQIQKAGFDDYLSKPYLIKDIEKLLHRYLKAKLPTGLSLYGVELEAC